MKIPEYFEFYSPVKILSGVNALDNLPGEIKFLKTSKPLLITDKGVIKAGIFKHVEEVLREHNIDFIVFDNVPPDSDLNVVKQIAKIYTENNRDIIVAVGGGSVIDTAKGVNILISLQIEDLKEVMGANVIREPLRPLIVIPTTAGTGSEATCVAVIKDRERDIKMLFVSQHLIPNVAILDVKMTATLPPFLTAATAMDALTHSIEAYISLQKNPVSDVFAWLSIKIISENLLKVLDNPKDSKGRLALANASLFAGIAFSNSMVGLVHSLGHSAGAVWNIHHGVTMNIFLPWVLEYNFDKISDELAELLLPFAGEEEYLSTPKLERGQKFIQKIRELQRVLEEKTGLPSRLGAAGARREDFQRVVELTLSDGSLSFNVKDAGEKEILEILEKSY
uniref:Iron-containing alcohol dehydrogenase n=1 Tax=candidate division WOR-3 bacterium TaxID=2052148 RepID=A0A7V3ZXA8_UNCW3